MPDKPAVDVDALVLDLAGRYKAVLAFSEQCRFLSGDALADEAQQLTRAANALFKATMYELAARDRGPDGADGA